MRPPDGLRFPSAPRVAVVASDDVRRSGLVRKAEEAGLSVALEAATQAEISDIEPAELDAIVLDEAGLELVTDAADTDDRRPVWHDRVALVFAESRASVARAAALGAAGWVVVPVDADGVDAAALVRAAARGYAVVAAEWSGPAAETPHGTPGRLDEEALVEPLTPREREVLDQLAAGLSNRQIGDVLGISDHTVKFHVSAIFGKLGVSTRAAAVRHGMQHGLVVL
ncbi:MAG: helix-turn-helix transcriptional regulator [Vicinamibacterales bacterium]